MEHLIPVPKANSVIMIEITPSATHHNLNLFLSFEKIPTFRSFLFTTKVSALPIEEEEGDVNCMIHHFLTILLGFHYWFLTTDLVQNRTGRWFLSVMELNETITETDTAAGYFAKSKISSLTTDYKLRTYTAGCYFLDERYEEWTGKSLMVESTTFEKTTCLTAHLTMFGTGFFVQPNSIDFKYVLAHADFTDNLTIYMTIITSLIMLLIFLIWGTLQDMKDVERMASHLLPDNDPADTYVYEIIVFTGNKAQATCRSKIQFIVNGDKDETDIRSFPQMSFKRGGIDSFLMTTQK